MEEKNTPLISVVIPCYKQAEYLPEALESLLKQTYRNWEAIIVNDGSPDDTESVAMEFVDRDKRIKFLSKENGGLSSARNKGIEMANGEFILPLDADDVIAPEYMEQAMMAFAENMEWRLVFCQAVFFGNKTGLWEEIGYRGYRKLLFGNSIFCSAFFRKSDWKRVGGYDEKMRTGHEDWEFLIRLLDEKAQVYQIPAPLFLYRIRDVSMSTILNRKDVYFSNQMYVYSKNREIYERCLGIDDPFGAFQELLAFRESRKRHKNKWYRKLYHKYIRRK